MFWARFFSLNIYSWRALVLVLSRSSTRAEQKLSLTSILGGRTVSSKSSTPWVSLIAAGALVGLEALPQLVAAAAGPAGKGGFGLPPAGELGLLIADAWGQAAQAHCDELVLDKLNVTALAR